MILSNNKAILELSISLKFSLFVNIKMPCKKQTMPNLKSILWISFSVFFLVNTYAQREKDTITPEKLIITKQYNPSVNDAFKIKKQPKFNDSILPKPQVLNYSILDVPVASTFTPAKGRAGGLRLTSDNLDNFNNYARVGAGNFTSILAEFFSELALNDHQRLNIGLSHFSSQGGIDEVELDDDFMTNALQLKFSSEEQDFVWDLHGGFAYNAYNYYGVPENILPIIDGELNDISQNYLSFNLGGSLAFYEAFFKNVEVDFSNFSDNFSSQENRFVLKPQVDFFIGDQRIENSFKFDYLGGEFNNESLANYNYAFAITAYNPNIQINEERFSLKLGADFTYLSDLENSEGSFYVYPKVEGSYQITRGNLIAFGGVDGGLDQNSYQDFSNSNPFISPTFVVAPTNRQYDAFLGLKGGSYALSYNAKVSYTSSENNPFFTLNNTASPSGEAFNYRNSFGLVYDDLNTLSLDVEIDYSLNNKLTVGFLANYSSYDVDQLGAAFNLPETTASLFANYKMNEKWKFGASVFYVGEREDLALQESLTSPFDELEIVTLSSFVDANLSVQYKINNQLHAFVEAKNIFGGNYERWLNYPVQDFQILGGVGYQFDW